MDEVRGSEATFLEICQKKEGKGCGKVGGKRFTLRAHFTGDALKGAMFKTRKDNKETSVRLTCAVWPLAMRWTSYDTGQEREDSAFRSLAHPFPISPLFALDTARIT